MIRDAATQRQVDAADPRTSTWLSANAGSGKTRVLTDRVARLLLEEVSPQNILCLTYTKAAAAEMQNRLFQRLGAWAMMSDDDLRAELLGLGVDRQIDASQLSQARTLFARAIETPGGLKIQTIHSFCAGVLRRFPLEAQVSPQFREMEDRAAEILRAEVVDDIIMGPQAAVVHQLLTHFTGDDLSRFTAEIAGKRDSFAEPLEVSDLKTTLGLVPSAHLCILSAINVGKIEELDELEELCDLAVRSLDEIIDHQKYPVMAAEISTKARRSLGIGYIGLAHYLAKKGYSYEQKLGWRQVDKLTEAFQYYLLKASNDLAKEKGPCEFFNRTKYSDGILPIDTYKKEVDEVVTRNLSYDWEWIRKEIKEHGLRHSTLSAQMPSESSSVVSNATNGIEPPRDYLSVKKSKKGPLKQVVPDYKKLKGKYTLLWDMKSNEGYINVVAVMQKYFDQAISGNWSYNPDHFDENQVPLSAMAQDLLTTYKLGWKTSYYQNTYDAKKDIDEPAHPIGFVDNVPEGLTNEDEDPENCDSCTI